TYRASGAARSIALNALALDLVVGEWTLVQPARLQLAGDSISVDSLELRGAGSGRIVASGTVAFRGPGRMAVAGDSLALVDVFTLAGRDTTGISGTMSFAAAVEGEADDPRMELMLTLRDGRYRDYRAPDLQVFGSYADRRLDLKGGVWSGESRLVALSGTVPINLALRGADRRVLADSLLLVARADSLNMALLGPIVTVVRDLEGSAQFDVRVAGTWEQPRLTGFIEVSSGALTIPAVGVRYRDMDVRLELQDTTLRVVRGRLRASGTLELSGAVYFPREGGLGRPRLDLAARADRFHAIEMRDFAGGTFSGDLTLRGPVLGAVVSGRVVANEGYLKFADLVEKRIVSLDDPEFRAIVDSNLARAAELGPDVQTVFLDSLRIRDFQIAMGNDFWLRSSEANIQLAGDFVVNKAVEDGLPRYRMDGTLRTVRGTYRLVLTTISKEFRVTQGTIRFFGTPDFNPEMDVSAEHVVRTVEGGQLTVRVQIGGTLLAPRLRLESDQRPPLTETEIVSYLMFGQPTAALQAGAAGGVVNRQALVQSITATLTGYAAGELGSALISDLGLPLDYITIRPGAGTAGTLGLSTARIEAGTQIGSRTFLILDAGLCEVRSAQAVGATVEYRMGSRWTATAALEPVVSNCQVGTGTSISADRARYQVGLDLFWSLGIR
ncbi:MAG TPA: translocation/assembly module TamB domain-containing protein, partial [Nevskiales bacterium]|nr:translocation/assembly module TamB domain-containing protein [Nevskiales bacterium]